MAQFCNGFNVSIRVLVNCYRLRADSCTYPTYHIAASATLADHIPSAVARFSVVATAIFHVEPVASASAVAKGFGTIDRDVLILAMEGRVDEGAAILDEAMMDKTAGTRKCVEGVEIDGSNNGFNDTMPVVRNGVVMTCTKAGIA
jgi:hypothetical protein